MTIDTPIAISELKRLFKSAIKILIQGFENVGSGERILVVAHNFQNAEAIFSGPKV